MTQEQPSLDGALRRTAEVFGVPEEALPQTLEDVEAMQRKRKEIEDWQLQVLKEVFGNGVEFKIEDYRTKE